MIAQAVFLLERGQIDRQAKKQTNRQTRLNALPTPAWVIKNEDNGREEERKNSASPSSVRHLILKYLVSIVWQAVLR